MAITLSELRSDTRSHIDEVSPRFWSDAELDRWIHEGLRDIARRAEILPDTKAYNVVADQENYDLPEDMLRIHRVEYRQTPTNLWALEFQPISSMDDIWLRSRMTSGSSPSYYTVWGHTGGSQQLKLYPIPSENTTGGLVVFYYRLPKKPIDGEDPIDIPAGWEDLVPLYVEHVARRKDNDTHWREAYDLYVDRLEQMIKHTRQPTDSATYISHSGMGLFSGNDWD